MINTDDVPIRIGFNNYRPDGQGELETWLAKEAEGGGVQPETNENAGTAAYSDLYTDPPGRRDVTNVDGHWGKKEQVVGGKGLDPAHNNTGTYMASQAERHSVVGRALASVPSAETNAQAVLSANFDHARTGDFTAHSLLLQSKTKEGAARPSMSERVRSIINRF